MKKRIAFTCMLALLALFIFAALMHFARAQSPVSITIDSSPEGSSFVNVNGTDYTTPQLFTWNEGDTATLEAFSPVPGPAGTRYVFTSWSAPSFESSTSQTYTYTVPNSSETVTANYQTQYYLTVSGGNSTTGQDWYNSGSTLTASSNGVWGRSIGIGTRCSSWNIDGGSNTNVATTGTVTTTTITMSTYHTVNFNSVTQYQVTLDSGATSALNSTTNPTITGDNYWYDAGTTVQIVLEGVYSRSSGTGTRLTNYYLNGGSANPVSTTGLATVFNSAISNYEFVTTSTVIQYFLTVNGGNTITYGTPSTISGDTGWYDSGTSTTVSSNGVWGRSGGTGSRVSSWNIDVGSNTNVATTGRVTTSSITMSTPHTANFNEVTQYYLTVTGGNSMSYGTASPTSDNWYDSTQSTTVSSDWVWGTSGGTRSAVSNWQLDTVNQNPTRSNTGKLTTSSVSMSAAHTVNFVTVTQYLLTVTGGSGVSVSGSQTNDQWCDSGTSGTATSSYVWNQITGQSRNNLYRYNVDGGSWSSITRANTGTYTAPSIIMSTYHTVNFGDTIQYYLTVTGGNSVTFGTASPTNDQWYDSGGSSTVSSDWVWGTILGQSRTVITTYTVDGTNQNPARQGSGKLTTVSVSMSTYHIVAFISTTQYYLTVTGGNGITYGTASSTGDNWYDSGSSTTVSSNWVWNVVPVQSRTAISNYAIDNVNQNPTRQDTGTLTTSSMTITNYHSVAFTSVTQYYLTVSSAYDSATPTSEWSDSGTSITESVTSPVAGPSGTQYVCTGWTGTGSVRSSGSGTTVTFTMAQPSSITWNWKTQYYLTVSSLYDSPTPSSGWFDSGSSINDSVTSPVSGGSGIQYVCTGWTGTGSVPSSGNSSSVTFTITGASSITWKWQVVQRRLTVYSAHDSPNPATGVYYFNDSSYVNASVSSPVAENGTVWTCTGWTGTGSVPSSGNGSSVSFTIVQDSSITWNWHGNALQFNLTVASVHGDPSPAVGDHPYDQGDNVTCSVTSPVTENGFTYVCTGWSGSGSVPSTGSDTVVNFTILEDSSITWNWQVAVWTLTVVSAHGSPSPAVGDQFYDDQASVTCNVSSPVVEAGVSYTCTGWLGTGSVPSNGSGISVTFSITENSSITWNWVVTPSVQWTLTVVSAHGNPDPAVGDDLYNDGASVTCNVSSPVVEAGVSYTCIGWDGTGSVPSSGSDISVTFLITENSSITWNWVVTPSVQWTLTVVSAHGSPSPAVGDHLYSDGSSVVCSVSSPVVEAGVSYTCTGWDGTGSVQSSGSGTSTTFSITANSSITWNWQVQTAPTIGGCDNTGVQESVFTWDETVYVAGAGYAKNQTFSIYVVNETTWIDGMALPERVQGTATSVSSDSSGNIRTTVVWNEPLTSGNYDILVDVNGNGKYDAQVDAFYSIQIVTLAESFLIPEYVFGTLLGLAGCFAALGAFGIYERKRR